MEIYQSVSEAAIKVTPAVLKEKAGEVSAAIQKMQQKLEKMEQIINRTKYYWEGSAGDANRRLYDEQKESVEIILNRLKEHPKDLLLISENYENVEENVQELSQELPGDVIQ